MEYALILGLGNIGERYKHTRHNAGFLCLEATHNLLNTESKLNGLEKLCGTNSTPKWRLDKRLEAIFTTMHLGEFLRPIGGGLDSSLEVILAAPTTFMNHSGSALDSILKAYSVRRLIVIYDDIDRPFGSIQFGEQGGSGGHNGIRSLQPHLKGLDSVIGVRIGVGASIFSSKAAFESLASPLDFDSVYRIYKSALESRLQNNKRYKTQTLLKAIGQAIEEELDSRTLASEAALDTSRDTRTEAAKNEANRILKASKTTHKSLNEEVASFVLSNFNPYENALLPGLLNYAALGIMNVIASKDAPGAGLLSALNIHQR